MSELLDANPWTIRSSTPYANAIDYLEENTDSPATLVSLEILFGHPQGYRYYEPSANTPKMGVAQDADYTLFLLGGISNREQAGRLAASWLDRNNFFGNIGLTQYSIRAAIECWSRYVLYFSGPRPKVRIAGYSFGGTVALALASQLRYEFPDRDYQVVTFGAPKSVGNVSQTALSGFPSARWVLTGDPVPALPPTRTQAPVLHALLSERDSTNLEGWTHRSLPFVIDANHVITTPLEEPITAPVTVTTILAAVNSTQGIFGIRHSIREYARSLGRNIPDAPALPVDPPSPSPTRPRPPAITPEILAEVQARRLVFLEEARAADATPSFIPSPGKFRAKRIEGVWQVHWNGHIICTGPSKRKCQAIARHWNRGFALFQGVGQSHSQEFVLALTEYLIDAARSDRGYIPPLRDGAAPPADEYDEFNL